MLKKGFSPRNKTIRTSVEEGAEYLARCITPKAPLSLDEAENRLLLGDAFRILELLPRQCADLIIVDPPYNLSKNYAGETFRRTKSEEYAEFTRRWLDLTLPLLKPDGSVYVCCDWQTSIIVSPILAEKLTLRNRITWQREKGRGAKRNWKNGCEDIWFATNSDEYTFNLDAVRLRRRVIAPYRENGAPKDWQETDGIRYRDTCPSNFWDDVTVPYWSMAENTAHPTQKPEKLIARLILASTEKGGLVLDPFAGSGTTAVTAKKLGRRFIAIEKAEQYCVWAQQRLELAETDTRIQGYEHGVFYDRNARM